MPKRRRPVETLKQLCFHVIIKNIPKFPTTELHCLPTNILEDFIRFPKDADEKLLSTEELLQISPEDKTRLITQNMKHLNLEFDRELVLQWTPARNFDLMNAVLRTSHSLTHFNCNSTGCWTHQDFLNFAVSIPNIVFLNLSDNKSHYATTLFDDDVLAAIGDSCLKLENLTLEWSGITDEGIQRFCQSKSRGSKIKHLKFDWWCKVTADGCLIALQNLKELKIFDYGDRSIKGRVIEAFMKLFQELNESQHPTFQLCELPRIRMGNLLNGVLNFITKCCPNLSCLSLYTSENFENDIVELRKCDVSFPLHMYIDEQFSMSHLTEVGSNLTNLELEAVDVELDLIGLACPNLKEFHLCNITCLPLNNLGIRHKQIPFSKVQKLVIEDCCIETIIPTSHLKFLLRHCLKLEEFTFCNDNEDIMITEDIGICVLHEIKPLRHLTSFTIMCPGVSKVSIMELLKMENNLQYLEIWKSIPADDDVIKSFIKKNNYWVNLCVH